MIKKITLKLIPLFVLLIGINSFAQQKKSITGTVTDEEGIPLIGATILIQNTDYGVSTDENGSYTLNAKIGDVLIVSYIFHETAYVTIDNKSFYKTILKSEGEILDDLVVIAYGNATKESLTGAVASIDAKIIENRPVSNAVGALEGAAAGIQINNTSGQPGSEPDVRIRGFTTINGSNSPLYVVDGTPYPGNISDLNPADIESITVLKDASASTLYGARASNGVIMINTKKASKGSSFLNVTAKQGIYVRGMKDYDRIGPDDFMETMWTGYRNSMMSNKNYSFEEAADYVNKNLITNILGTNIYTVPEGESLFDNNGNLNPNATIMNGYRGDLDWYKDIERTGYRQDYVLNGRVANDKGGAYFSLGLLNDEGYIKKTDFKRLTARVNADYKANDWLKLGANLAGSHQESNLINGDADNNGSYTNPFMFARNIAPIYSVHKHDLTTGEFLYDEYGNKIFDNGANRKQYVDRHVTWENELNTLENIRTTVNGQFFADIKFLEDFTFTIKGDLSLRNNEERKYENAIIGDGAGNNGRSKRTTYRYKSYMGQQLLNWSKSFGEHYIEALAGHENYSETYNYMYGMKGKQNLEGMIDWVNFNETINLTDYDQNYRTEGYFTRFKYNYSNKYYAETSFRRDGSSKFHKDNRWGNFWSVGGGWIISNEDFFKIKDINLLKLRASYGEVGNDTGADRYAYQTLYTMKKNGGMGAFYKDQNGNKNLKWETSSSTDLGIETRIFNRANITIEYFNKESQNLLFDKKEALSEGSTNTEAAESILTVNMGKISNRGLELTFDVDIIKTTDLTWNVGFNATWMKNKIKRLPEENRENGYINGSKKYVEGKSIYEFYLYQHVGVDSQTGRSLYVFDNNSFSVNKAEEGKQTISDANKDIIEIDGNYYALNATYAKKEFSGSAIPDMYGSFSTALTYKNFTLSGLVTYSIGGKIYDYSYRSLMNAGDTPSALHKEVLNSYDMNNKSTERILYGANPSVDFFYSDENNLSLSNRFLKDASYLAIKNITLSYNMPQSLISKLGLTKFNINGSIENLATFTKLKGMNPQQAFNGTNYNAFVTPRTYTIGLSLGF